MIKKLVKTQVSVDTLASELKQSPQWVLWKPVQQDEKSKKVPVDKSGTPISPVDKANWMDFKTASEAQTKHHPYKGLGYVLNGDFVVIDLDNCIIDGEVEASAMEIINYFQSYTEVSVSGSGIHIFLKGDLPQSGRRSDKVECYSSKRFIAVTGMILDGFETIKNEQERLNKWFLKTFPPSIPQPINSPIITPSMAPYTNEEILEKMFTSKIGEKIRSTYDGLTKSIDHNRADLALCRYIVFYTQDIYQVDSIFRSSQLMRHKWDEKRGKETYGQRTMKEALRTVTNYYKGT